MTEGDPAATPSSSDPLRPGATIEEIQARVAHLSSASAAGDASDSSAEGAESARESIGAVAPSVPMTEWATTAAATSAKPQRRGLRAGLGGAGALAIGIAIVVAKLGLKIGAVGLAAAALTGVFGGRYDELPESQRKAFEQRFDAALGTSLDDLSEDDRTTRLNELVSGGASRLGDDDLVRWAQLDAKARSLTDVATCATIARGWFVRGTDLLTIAAAVSKAYESLSTDEFGAVIDLDLKAIEAETAKSPAVRSISDEAVEPVFAAFESALSKADADTIDALTSGTSVTDAAACSAIRAVDSAAVGLSPANFTSWAVWQATP